MHDHQLTDLPLAGKRATVTIWLLRSCLSLALGTLALDVLVVTAINADGELAMSEQEATTVFGVAALVMVVGFACHIAAAIAFCMWIYRLRWSMIGLGTRGMRYSPGYAVGSFFIPFVNLVVPFRAMKEAWKASDPASGPDSWAAGAVPPFVGLWWVAWIFSGLLQSVASRILERDPVAAVTSEAAGCVAEIIAAFLCIRLVRHLTSRVQAQAESRGSNPTDPEPMPAAV